MTNSNDREFSKSFPRPFLMDALQYLTTFELSATQQKAIAILNLTYFKNCAQEEINLIDAVIAELGNLERKG
ncbi:MAG: hypothetical protein IH591_00345 [Bacteroidales bacterium]|nr:hypothetical protein [Bacteroidales bacterium]